ncbi:hypothetical protein J3458_003528 [Metarhizium acridum]|uniref:uncharacterized protein n=1 Tax=Metarhizium acridum TaxID=92637 RepID=UPI001C6CD257|nr:hypothetical protein J3458_003528 [Metarhizium acridum]
MPIRSVCHSAETVYLNSRFSRVVRAKKKKKKKKKHEPSSFGQVAREGSAEVRWVWFLISMSAPPKLGDFDRGGNHARQGSVRGDGGTNATF